MKKRLFILLTVFVLLLQSFCVWAEEGDLVNAARYQMAVASTEADGHEADMANDGINDNADHTYFKAADGDTKAWWQVDLGLPYKLNKIELETRKEATNEEKINIKILASDNENFKNSEVIAEISEEFEEVFTAEITKKAKYRYIRVEKTDGKAFSIGEIRVLVKKSEIAQGMDTVSLAGQIPATDPEGRYTIPYDVIGTKYEKAVSLLSALNIMRGYPDGDFLPDDAITRAEFTTVAMRLKGNEVVASTRTFVDVPVEHWAYSYIENAANTGIVNGVGNEMFMPDSPVLTSQVIKILVSALGYGDAAEVMGGYPAGYINIATQIGLYKDVVIENGENITRGEIAMLCYNALECDVMTPTAFGENGMATAIKGRTVLSDYLSIAKDTGIVTGAGNTSLTKVNSKKGSTYLEIDSVAYTSDIPNLAAYIGYSVEFYYEDDEKENIKNVVAIIVHKKNEVVKIEAEELLRVSENILYYGKEDEESIALAADMDLIYNGVCLSVYDKKVDLIPKAGSVTLIDNDGDGEIEVYIVNKIDNYVVNWVNAAKEQVYSKNVSGVLNLDSAENDVTIINKSTGGKIAINDILEWNILSVMESRNSSGKKCLNVIVSTELVRGVYKEKGRDYIVIDDRTFKVADCFDPDSVELGAKGIFYLDAENKIAAYNGNAEPGEMYGFLRAAGADNENIEMQLKMRVFTKDGKFETLYGKENIIIDGREYSDPKAAESYLLAGGMEGTAAQAIRYTVNAKGQVTSIATERGGLSKDYDAKAGEPAPMSSGKGYYYTTAGTFDASFSVDTETVMIELPTSGITVEKDYKLLTSAGVRAGRYYYVQAFDTGEERVAKLVVFTGGASGGASDSTTFFLAEDIIESVNEDGENLYQVTGLYAGEKKSYFVDDDIAVNVDDFKAGNILTLAFSGELIKDYELKFFRGAKPEGAPSASVSEETPQYGANIQGLMGTLWFGYGTVETKKNGLIRISFENPEVANPGSGTEFVNYKELLVNLANVRIYYYDSAKNKVHLADSGYILDKLTVGESEASKVLVKADSGNFNELIILD